MSISEEEIVTALRTSLSELTSRSMAKRAIAKFKVNLDQLDRLDSIKLMGELSIGIKLYLKEAKERDACIEKLLTLFDLPDSWNRDSIQAVKPISIPALKRKLPSATPVSPTRRSTPAKRRSPALSSMAPKEIDEDLVLRVLGEYLSNIIAKSVWKKSIVYSDVDLSKLKRGDSKRLLRALHHGIRLYIEDTRAHKICSQKLREALIGNIKDTQDERPIVIHAKNEMDIVKARRAGLDLCQILGFSKTEQIKITTAISELTRNIVQYAGYGQVRMSSIGNVRKGIEVVATDDGPGIPNLDEILRGDYVSKRGMGKGIVGTKNLMDFFEIKTETGKGTTVTTRKYLDR